MEWSSNNATNAYLDALKLCKGDDPDSPHRSLKPIEPETDEFLSALAAGMSAKLIVEFTSSPSSSTIALAAAARHTGGRLVCIIPEENMLDESTKAVQDSGLRDMVEFKVGDPYKLVPRYENIDFSLVDCQSDDHVGLLKLLDVNPKKSVVVAKNVGAGKRSGVGGCLRSMKGKLRDRSVMDPIGKGIVVTKIGKGEEYERVRERFRSRYGVGVSPKKVVGKSRWLVKVDEESGEEHIFRVPRP